MFEFIVSETWQRAYPAGHAGILVMRGVLNPPGHPSLEQRKQALESQLRSRYAGMNRKALLDLPVLQAYNTYYKGFKKTYHVQLQLESLIFKGRSFPRVSALVDAMFMAELSNLLLTAGHDREAIQGPLRLEAASGAEQYTTLQGEVKNLKAGDMYITDQVGIISSVLYGPDQRTQITAHTQDVIYTVYAPAGIPPEIIYRHLEELREYVLIVSPLATVEKIEVVGG